MVGDSRWEGKQSRTMAAQYSLILTILLIPSQHCHGVNYLYFTIPG